MIRRWYRSVLFWFGWPGFLFLLWAWLGFTDTDYRASLHGRTGHWSAVWGTGYFGVHLSTPKLELDGSFPVTLSEGLWGGEEVIFAKAFTIQGRDRDWWRRVEVACWVFALLYLAAWFAAVAVSQRRKSRLLKHHAPPPP